MPECPLVPRSRAHAILHGVLRLVCLLAATLVFGVAARAATQIVYVASFAHGSNDGSSWANAYPSLATALTKVSPTVANPVEIWIADGVYKPTTDSTRTATFQLQSYLTLRGGFLGTEASASQRPASATATGFTVLSGDIGTPQSDTIGSLTSLNDYASVGFDTTSSGAKDNSYNVLLANNVSSVVLDRLVVAGGYANSSSVTDLQIETMLDPSPDAGSSGFRVPLYNGACGGGLSATDSFITITDCWFAGNFANGSGGAIAVSRGSVTLQNSRLINNVSFYAGGALAAQGAQIPDISGNEFYANNASYLAGALFIEAASNQDQPKSYVTALLSGLAALTLGNDTPPPGAEPHHTATYDAVKLARDGFAVAKTLGKVAFQTYIKQAATEGLILAPEAAAAALENTWQDYLGYAYGGFSAAVALTDIGLLLAESFGDLSPDDIKGWTEFDNIFNEYLTPVGLVLTIAKDLLALAYTPAAPTPAERATAARRTDVANNQNQASPINLSNNRFELNFSAGLGGGLVVLRANAVISDSWFLNNTATSGGSAGAFMGYNTVWVESSTFSGNSATYGNTLTFGFRAIGRLVHDTIVDNHTASVHGYAVGADNGADVSIINSVLWKNTNGDITSSSNVNQYGGADLFATRKADLGDDALNAYNAAGDSYTAYIGIIDVENSDVQSLNRLAAGTALFTSSGPSSSEAYQGTLALSSTPNVGEGIRPVGGLGNISRDPQLASDLYPNPVNSPLIDTGRNNLFFKSGGFALGSDRVYGAYGSGPDIGAIESDGTLPGGTILYVDASVAASGNGLSWGTAFKTLAEACAVPLSQGAQIWVAPGTYHTTSGTNRATSLNLQRGVTLVGSLPSGSTSFVQSNPSATPTIISGNIGDSASSADNSYSLLSGTDFDFYSIVRGQETPRSIRGIRFTAAQGTGSTSAVDLVAPVIIQNCTFDHNAGGRALTIEAPTDVDEGTSARVTDSTFDTNSGGAIDCAAYNLDVLRCQFFNNTAATGVGVLKRLGQFGPTSLSVIRSVFYNNTATSWSSAVDSQDTTLEIDQNTIVSNTGVAVWWGVNNTGTGIQTYATANLALLNNILYGNRIIGPAVTTTPIEYQQFGYANPLGQGYAFIVSGNDIEGLYNYAALTGASSNVDYDPLFVDATGENFQLNASSYVANRGVTTYVPGDTATINGIRDIGAYETEATTVPAPLASLVYTTLPITDDGRVFTLQLSTSDSNPHNFTWQVKRSDGTGFTALGTGDAPVFTNISTGTLTITNPGRDLSGAVVRVQYTGNDGHLYYSQNYTLNAAPGVVYVVPGGAGKKNGGSWANAYAFVNDACNNVSDGTQIWIAQGTYTTGSYQPGAFIIHQNNLTIPPGVSLYGGFVGTETSRSQRPAYDVDSTPSASRTILVPTQNAQLVQISGTGSVANVLDRVDLSGGETALIANGTNVVLNNVVTTGQHTRGLWFTGSQITLTDSRFNSLWTEPLRVESTTATLTRTQFVFNGSRPHNTTFAGIIAIDSPLTLADCLFNQNVGMGGGAIVALGVTSLDIQRTTFENNFISNDNLGGGAILYGSTVAGRVANSLFVSNHSGYVTGDGNSGSAVLTTSTGALTLLQCTVAGNSVDRGSGAALQGSISLINSVVWGNTAEKTATAVAGNVTAINSYVQGQAPLGYYDPAFANPSAGDYHLTGNSPLRNLVQINDPNTGGTDLDGNPRNYAGGLADLGAYEYQAAATTPVPVFTAPVSATAFAGNPVSFNLVAVSSFDWKYYNGTSWVSLSGLNGWSVTSTPVTVGGTAATSYTLSNSAVPVDYIPQVTFRAVPSDNPDFYLSVTLTVNARHTLYVNVAATAGGNGSSWATAFNSISAALAAADAGTDLWIAGGDYTEASIPTVANVRYYPGFAGTETLVTQRNPATHPVNLVGTASKLPFAPSDSRTPPSNTRQISVAPVSAAIYVDRPVSFTSTATTALDWQYSMDSGATWSSLSIQPSWIVSTSGSTSTVSLNPVTSFWNGVRLRSVVTATGEFSTSATLTAKARHVIYVNVAASAGGNGSSWASAYKTLAAALAVADDGADIWIAAGTYNESGLSVPTGVEFFPGFTGTETLVTQRDASAHKVVISNAISTVNFNPANPAVVPPTVSQLTAAPASATVYAANPASFTASASIAVTAVGWQFSADGGTSWVDAAGLTGWTVTTSGNVSTLATSSASAIHNGYLFRATIAATAETSAVATFTVLARKVVYVNASAASGGDGTTWAKAFKTITAALNSASASVAGGFDIWIAAGDYNESSIPTVANVRYYPGFAGNESTVLAQDTAAHPVRLIGAASYLPYAPAEAHSAPVNSHQITAAPVAAAAYVERPVSFSATSPATLVWQYSTDGATWLPLSGLTGYNASVTVEGISTASVTVTADLNNAQVRAMIAATGESSKTAILTAKPRVPLRVDSRVSASGDGLSWATAFKTIADALAVADDGSDLWVAAGTYLQPQLNLPDGVHIYPGFAGTETSVDQRNSTTNVVSLQGVTGTVSFSGASTITAVRFAIVTPPRDNAPYVANPATFTATRAPWSTSTLAWQYSTDGGSTWQGSTGLTSGGWTITTSGATTTLSYPAVTFGQDGMLFRVVAADVQETSVAARLVVKARITRYLNGAVSSSGDGTSWATAYKTFSAALAAIDNGTDLWVAAGDYTEATHTFVSGAVIYGGFNGTETLLTQRAIATNVVTLRSTAGSIFTTNLGTLGALSGITRLDGVTLALGTAPGGQAAISLNGTAPYFANVTFTGHAQALTSTGGALVELSGCSFTSNTAAITADSGSLVLDGCTFSGNTNGIVATGGCAISIDGGSFTGHTGTALLLGTQANTLVQPQAVLNGTTFTTNAIGISAYGGGVTLTNCDFEHNTDSAVAVLDACQLTVTGGTFANNTSSNAGAAIRLGGTNPYARYPVVNISGATFSGNQAANGGAIDAFAKNNTVTISHSIFTGNAATGGNGGVLRVRDGSVVAIDSSTFTSNSATLGGGIYAFLSKSVTLTNNAFAGNSASSAGAALYVDTAPLAVSDTTFIGNQPTGGYATTVTHAGDITGAGAATFTRCTFTGNRGPSLFASLDTCVVRDSLFAGNTYTGSGTAISAGLKAKLSLLHVTVADNVATDGGSLAAAISVFSDTGGTLTIRNSILWNNSGGNFSNTVEGRQLMVTTTATAVSLDYNTIQGLATFSSKGTGNLAADPFFVDSANGNYRLSTYSDVIDRGSAAYDLAGETDLDGNVRNQADAPDLGAYEAATALAATPAFTSLPTTLSAPLSGTLTVTLPSTPGYTATWQILNGGWQTLTTTTSSAFASSVTIGTNPESLTITGLKSAINNTQLRVVFTNGHDTYTSSSIPITIQAFSVIYVDGSLGSSGDGTSWSTAFKTVTEALAAVDGARRTLWIAEGTYPTVSGYQIPQGVEVDGGFPAGGSTFALRAPATHLTVLSGGNTEVVRFVAGDVNLAQSVLDGVKVTGGQTGILADSFSPTLRNLVVSGNSATGLVLRNTTALVQASTFESNTGVNGGGIAIVGGTPTLDRIISRGNTATLGGGLYGDTGFHLTSSLLSGNLAATGGGLYITGYPLVEQVTVASNRATTTGSGIYVTDGNRLTLTNSIVWGNGALPLTTANAVFTAAYTLNTVTSDAAITGANLRTFNPYFPSAADPASAPTTAGVYTVPAYSTARDAGQFIAANASALDLAGQPRVAFGTVDLGAYEGIDARGTPYAIIGNPASLTFRRDGLGNTFTASATTATGYEWQIATPSGSFVSLLGNANFSGANTSTLTVLTADYSLNGYRVRAVVSGPGGTLTTTEAVLTVQPTRYYVKSGASAGGNGDSWATAFQSLQAALATIPYDTSGTEIWISGGDYLATTTLNLSPGQTIYGGFAGTETSLAARTLSGTATRLIAPANATKTINLLSSGTTGLSFHLDGVTLDTTTAQTGCAIDNESTRDLLLEHVRILHHERSIYQAAANTGDTVGALTIRYSEIRGNGDATIDGSLVLRGGSALIENSLIAGNRASISAAELSAPAVLRQVTFAGNLAYTALSLNDSSNKVYNCIFWGNRNGMLATSIQPSYRDTGNQNVIEGYQSSLFVTAAGNFSGDPSFASAAAASAAPTTSGDYHLLATSAAIDLGDDTQTGTGSIDLGGSTRVQSAHVDAGAYEYQGTDLYRIVSQPVDATALSGPATFTVVTAPGNATYAWEESGDNGATYTPVSGGTSASLTVTGTPANQGHLFRARIQFANGQQLVSNAARLTSLSIAVTADIAGGYGTPRTFTVTAGVTPDSLQWQFSIDGTNFTDVAGATSVSLAVIGDASFTNRTYRVKATYAVGGTVYSNALAFTYLDLSATPGSASTGIASSLTFGLTGGGVKPSTLTNSSLFMYAGLTGRLTLANLGSPVFSGDNVSLSFNLAPHAGERIQVTTTSAIMRPDGFGVRPHVWEFRTPVTSGAGAFAVPTSIGSAGATAFALGDVNSDGSVDALVATAAGLQLYTNNGSATFTASGSTFGPAGATAVVLGSVAGTGALDAVVITASGDVQIWTNNGAGAFTLTQTLAGAGARALALGDLDADGDLDLAVATATGTRVWLNNGSGTFAAGTTIDTAAGRAVAIGDLDQDGDLDVVVSTDTSTTVWLNNGSATFTGGASTATGYTRIALTDLDADGRLDVVLVRAGTPAVLWHNLGSGTFATLAATPGGGNVTTLATGDIDGDGRADLFLTDSIGRAGAWITSSALASTRYANQPYFTLGAAAELADLDGDGALDLFALDATGKPSVSLYHIVGTTGDEDTTFTIAPSGFLPAPSGNVAIIRTQPAHGTLVLDGNSPINHVDSFAGSVLTYQPVANFTGLDSFTWGPSGSNNRYTYWIYVRNVTDPVTAAADSITMLLGDTATVLDGGATSVLANDTSIDPGPFAATVLTGPAHGSLTLNADGTFSYVNDGTAAATDSFTYRATNLATSSSADATVTIGLTRHNTAPSALAFTAASGTLYTDQAAGGTVGTLSATDPDAADAGALVYTLVSGTGSTDNASFTISGTSLKTAAVIDSTSGITRSVRIRATDTLGLYVEQAFTISFTQAPTATAATITTPEDTPVAVVLAGAGGVSTLSWHVVTQPAHGTLVLSTTAPAPNSYVYTPAAYYHGTDTLTYNVSDSALTSATVTITLNVTAVEHAPTLAAVSPITINEDNSATFTLAGSDVDGDALTYQLVGPASFGTVSFNGAVVTYTPNANANGTETLKFTVSDGVQTADPIQVTINVTPVNDAPVIAPITARTITRNTTDVFTPTITDVDGDTTTIRFSVAPQHGSVSASGHTITYVPTTSYTGTDSYTLIASDGSLDSAPVTVSVSIVNAATENVTSTVYRGLYATTDIPTATSGDWTGVTPANISTPAHGTAVFDGTRLLYTHNGDAATSDSFTYTLTSSSDDLRTIAVALTISDRVISVTNNADSGAGTLRAALDTVASFASTTLSPAHTTAPDWTVTINTGAHSVIQTTTYYTPTKPDISDFISPYDFSSAFNVVGNVTIDASASSSFILGISQGNAYARNFVVSAGSSLTLKSMTVINGRANRDGFRDSHGGLVLNHGSFTASNVSFRVGEANVGAALYNDGGTMVITDCSFSDNTILSWPDVTGSVIASRNGSLTLTRVNLVDSMTPEVNIIGDGALATVNVSASSLGSFLLTTLNGGTLAITGLPRPINDALDYPVNQTLTLDLATLLANDLGTAAVSVAVDTTSAQGVTITRTGNTLSYLAPSTVTGSDSFNYTVTDAAGLTATATVTLTFKLPAAAPHGNADTATVYRGLSTQVDVLANDTDDTNDTLTITAVSTPARGTAQIVNSGTRILYTQNDTVANQSATTDTFTYSVSNSSRTTTSVAVTVTINDRVLTASNGGDSGGGTLRDALGVVDSYRSTTLAPAHTTPPDWTIKIVNADYQQWRPSSNDGGGYPDFASAYRIHTNSRVTIDASPSQNFQLNNPSTPFNPFDFFPAPPIRAFLVESGASLTLKYLTISGNFNDTYPNYTSGGAVLNYGTFVADHVTFQNLSAKYGGALLNDGGTASLIDSNFSNNTTPYYSDQYAGVVASHNGSLSLTRVSFNDGFANPELYVWGDGATASLTVTNTPMPSYRFSGSLSVSGIAYAVNDTLSRPQGTTLAIPAASLLANDSGSSLSIVGVDGNSNWGAPVVLSGNLILYSPPDWLTNDDTFNYTIQDGNGITSTATVLIHTTDGGLAPVANADTVTRPSGLSLKVSTATLLANDTSPTGQALTLVSVDATSAQGATVTITNGTIFYNPPAGMNSDDSFSYLIRDASGVQVRGTVNVSVTGAPSTTQTVVQISDDGSGGALIKLIGIPNKSYTVSVSTDLINWSPLATVTSDSTGNYTVDDPTGPADGAGRYYRAERNN